jgi:hypothetical protein
MSQRIGKFEITIDQYADHYTVTFIDLGTEPKTAVLTSEKGNLQDTKERRYILDGLFGLSTPFAYVVRQKLFPEDTLTFDTVKTEHGTKVCNPRYPDEEQTKPRNQ